MSLYMDAYKRIAATMDTPILTVGEKGLLKVMSVGRKSRRIFRQWHQ